MLFFFNIELKFTKNRLRLISNKIIYMEFISFVLRSLTDYAFCKFIEKCDNKKYMYDI